MIPLSLSFLSILFLLTLIYMLKRSLIFSVYYTVLFIYTIFTAIAYVYFPLPIEASSGGQYYGLMAIYPYLLFTTLSFMSIWVVFRFTYKKLAGKKPFFEMRYHRGQFFRSSLFVFISLLYGGLLWFLVITSYDKIAYDQQHIIKETRGFLLFLSLAKLFILAIYVRMDVEKWPSRKIFHLSLMFWVGSAYLITVIRGGSRNEIASVIVGFAFYNLTKAFSRPMKPFSVVEYQRPYARRLLNVFRANRLTTALKIAVVGLFGLYSLLALQIARRAGEISLGAFTRLLVSPGQLFGDYVFSLFGMIMQDYTGPSLVLISSIQLDIIIPQIALTSVLLNCLPLVGYPTLGFLLSRWVNPELAFSWEGYGYYILAEGYNIAGWFGIIYNAVVFNLGLYLWCRFAMSDDRYFNGFVGAVVVMQVIDVVRGQSSTFIRASYSQIVPSIFLYFLLFGLRPSLGRKHRNEKRVHHI